MRKLKEAIVEKGNNIFLEMGQLWFHFDRLVELYEDNVVGYCP